MCFDLDGPVFIELIVEQGAVYPQDYVQLHSAERRARFRAAFESPGVTACCGGFRRTGSAPLPRC